MTEKVYLGDAVYAQFDVAASSIILTTEDGVEVTNRIVLEPDVIDAFNDYVNHVANTLLQSARAEQGDDSPATPD